MSESPPSIEKCSVENSFARSAAVFSISTPLVPIFGYICLFGYLQSPGHTQFTTIYVIGFIVLLFIVLGFVSGIIALAITKKPERKGIFGRALIGICLNGLLMVSLIIVLLILPFVAGTKYPMTPQGLLDKATDELSAASSDETRFYALDDAAKESFNVGKTDDASNYANEILKLAPKFQDNWNYGNAIQDGNLVLGRIAVRDRRIEESKEYLLEAGKSPGSPVMDSFGPNMSLAKDLLEKGERVTVLQYFELCRKFWEDDCGKLNHWRDEVKAGKIPNFGANLDY